MTICRANYGHYDDGTALSSLVIARVPSGTAEAASARLAQRTCTTEHDGLLVPSASCANALELSDLLCIVLWLLCSRQGL